MLTRRKQPPPRESPIRRMINGYPCKPNRLLRRRRRSPLHRVIHDASCATSATCYTPGPRTTHHQLLHSASCRLVFSMLRLLRCNLLSSFSLWVWFGLVWYGKRLRHVAAVPVDGIPRFFSALHAYSSHDVRSVERTRRAGIGLVVCPISCFWI